LDGVCITEHQTITGLDLETLSIEYDFKLFGGIEMEIAPIGHFLCYGDISVFSEVPILYVNYVSISDLYPEVAGRSTSWGRSANITWRR
jgi:hypothetical protein